MAEDEQDGEEVGEEEASGGVGGQAENVRSESHSDEGEDEAANQEGQIKPLEFVLGGREKRKRRGRSERRREVKRRRRTEGGRRENI
jgi:hypothetical protein